MLRRLLLEQLLWTLSVVGEKSHLLLAFSLPVWQLVGQRIRLHPPLLHQRIVLQDQSLFSSSFLT